MFYPFSLSEISLSNRPQSLKCQQPRQKDDYSRRKNLSEKMGKVIKKIIINHAKKYDNLQHQRFWVCDGKKIFLTSIISINYN